MKLLKRLFGSRKPALNKPVVSGSVFKGDCDKNIHWYVGIYSQGQWIYNKCAYCGKRQNQ